MEKFLQGYIKEVIINEFIEWSILHRSQDLVYLRDIADNKPVITMASVDGASGDEYGSVVKFALTNVIYFNKFKYRIERYAISGIISQLNNGRIIITSFDVDA